MDHHRNRIRDRLAAGGSVIGAKIDLASPDIIEIVGRAGYDFAWIDGEHGAFGLETALHMMRAADAAGTTPIFRVPSQDPSGIMRALDAGAMGVIVPNIASPEQARAVVAAAKYKTAGFPQGRRGACPRIRASGHQAADWNTFAGWSNDTTSVWLLIESVEGASQASEIARVDGVDAVMLGPFDLSVDMGLPGEVRHPAVERVMKEVAVAVLEAGKQVVPVLLGQEHEEVAAEMREWESLGCRIFNVISDRRELARSMRGMLLAVDPGRAAR